MAARYHYQPIRTEQEQRLQRLLSTNKKTVILAAAIVIALLVVYTTSTTITGFATRIGTLEQQIKTTQDTLTKTALEKETCVSTVDQATKAKDKAVADLAGCQTTMASSQSELSSCRDARKTLEENNRQLTSMSQTCQQERITYLQKLETEVTAKNSIIRNTIRAVCCSFSDIQTNMNKTWGLTNTNAVTCSGNHTVQCGTGETDF
ncbi:MAG: hypothetical protein HY832_03695 [Candidatus Aenigmarchaeota archaeon]|nr:hypothetical protein [Candidatus Aenigmarchaeota archaeon]